MNQTYRDSPNTHSNARGVSLARQNKRSTIQNDGNRK